MSRDCENCGGYVDDRNYVLCEDCRAPATSAEVDWLRDRVSKIEGLADKLDGRATELEAPRSLADSDRVAARIYRDLARMIREVIE